MKIGKWMSSKRLLRSEIYPAEEKCPICGYMGHRDQRLTIQKDPDVYLLLCPRCFGLSASQMPKREALDRYYGSFYAQRERERVTFYKPARLARHLASKIRIDSSHDIRIVDFGGGDGSVSVSLAGLISQRTQRRVYVHVVDYDCAVREPSHGERLDVQHVRELKDAPDGSDLIIASAVFEHIPNLAAVLTEIVGKLGPAGSLYARTPYLLPFMRLFGFEMVYPGHVHDLGDRFWGNLPKWFSVPIDIVLSQPSIVESGFRQDLIHTLAAYCLKLPAHIECLYTRHPAFKLYGGWEVVMRHSASACVNPGCARP